MGWVVDTQDGVARIWHNGGTFGFTSCNMLYPAQHLAIIALTNTGAPIESIAARLFELLNPAIAQAAHASAEGEDPKITARAKEWLHRFSVGEIDRAQLDATMSRALTPQLIGEAKTQLAPLGYRADFESMSLLITMSIDRDGKIDGFFFSPA